MTPPDSNTGDELGKVLDDAYRIGVDAGAGRWDDYPTLKPGMVKKLEGYAIQRAVEELGNTLSFTVEGTVQFGYIRRRIASLQAQLTKEGKR